MPAPEDDRDLSVFDGLAEGRSAHVEENKRKTLPPGAAAASAPAPVPSSTKPPWWKGPLPGPPPPPPSGPAPTTERSHPGPPQQTRSTPHYEASLFDDLAGDLDDDEATRVRAPLSPMPSSPPAPVSTPLASRPPVPPARRAFASTQLGLGMVAQPLAASGLPPSTGAPPFGAVRLGVPVAPLASAPAAALPPLPPPPAPPVLTSAAPQAFAQPSALAVQPVMPAPYAANATDYSTVRPPVRSRTRLVLAIVAGLLGILLMGAVALLLLQREGTLLVTVSGPNGEKVDDVVVMIDGEASCPKAPCRVKALAPGKHVVVAKAAKYRPTEEQDVTIRGGREAVLNVKLDRPAPGGLRIEGPAGLVVLVDGKESGKLPVDLTDLEPGEHVIRVRGNDVFADHEQKASVRPASVDTVEIAPRVARGTLRVELGSTAVGAAVSLVSGDARTVVKDFPHEVALSTDIVHFVEAVKAGLEPFVKTVEFQPGHPSLRLVVELRAAEAEESDVPAPVAAAPVAVAGKLPAPKPAGAAAVVEPGAADGAPVAPAAPVGGTGTVNVNSIPPSSVSVNGQARGSTPKTGIQVKAGRVIAVFSHPELGTETRSAVVQPGGTITLAVRFKPKP